MTGPEEDSGRCATCYGTGEIVSEGGGSVCPDCLGRGRASGGELVEWRLRDIERAHRPHAECKADVEWLVFELRRHRAALLEVHTRCQDTPDDSPLVRELKHVTNDALGLYQKERRES